MLHWLSSLPLAKLLRRGSERFNVEMGLLVAFSGLTSAGLMAIINTAAENASNTEENGRLLGLFLITVVLWASTQRFILVTSISEVERLLNGIRVEIADLIRRADLETLEHIGRSEIYGVVSRQTQQISQAGATLIMALQSAVMVFFSVAYLAMVSKIAFVITIGMSTIAILLHMKRVKVLNAEFSEAQRTENEFLGLLSHLLEGFKETRMSRLRSSDLFQHLRAVSVSVERVKTKAGREFSSHMILSQLMFYALLGGIVFLLPRISGEYSETVMKLTAAILFIIGPMGAIVGALPVYSNANVAAQNILDLEATLAARVNGGDAPGRPEADTTATFERIELKKVVFQYAERGTGSVFRLGPVDLEIDAGQILFLTGGNGSGKSTLLKVLVGLYRPQSGSTLMDNVLGVARDHRLVSQPLHGGVQRLSPVRPVVWPQLGRSRPCEGTAHRHADFGQDGVRKRPVHDAGPVERPAQAARAGGGAARGSAHPGARRMGRRSGSAVPEVLLSGAAARTAQTGQDGHRRHARRQVLRCGGPRREAGLRPAYQLASGIRHPGATYRSQKLRRPVVAGL